MTGAIKINGTYGAKVGNLQVFTYEGAIKTYKIFCQLFNRDMTHEASVVAGKAAEDLHKLGFSWEEIEQFEIETIA